MQSHNTPETSKVNVTPMSRPEDYLAVALDVQTTADALACADLLVGRCAWVKVGMELFYAEGAAVVKRLQDRGFKIFLDLKLHDIPNTVAAAVHSLKSLSPDLLTVHTAGGESMLRAASKEAFSGETSLLLAGVTVLTSMDEHQLEGIGVAASAQDQVMRLAALALDCDLGALVSSPLEVAALRSAFGEDPFLVVPGVRPEGSATNDQNRVATPQQAIRDGASLLVVGRPITRARSPADAVEAILVEIASGLEELR